MTKRWLLPVLMGLVILCIAQGAWATDAQMDAPTGLLYTVDPDTNTATIVQLGNGAVAQTADTKATLNIPQTVGQGIPVVKIGDSLCRDNDIIKTVNMPSVQEVGYRSFWDCYRLTTVNMPSVRKIGELSFYHCENLKTVNMTKVEIIDDKAFENCYKLTNANMPNVKEIGSLAFNECRKLGTVIMPKVEIIADRAFEKCSKLTKLNMPNIKTIKDSAFSKCTRLASVTMPNVKTIGAGAFYECKALKAVAIPMVETIESGTFGSCSNLTSVNMTGVKTINYGAFYGCTKLAAVNIPNAKIVDDRAFRNCAKLATVYMPNVQRFNMDCFFACKKLKTIWLDGQKLISVGDFSFDRAAANITVYLLDDTEPDKQQAVIDEVKRQMVGFGYAKNPKILYPNAKVFHTVTLLAAPFNGGTVSGGGDRLMQKVKTPISAQASPLFAFDKWTKTGAGSIGKASANATLFTVGANDAQVTANFKRIAYNVKAAANDDAFGTVSIENAGDQAVVNVNAKIALTAMAKEGYAFAGWSANVTGGKFADGNNAATTYTMPNQTGAEDDIVLTAKFVKADS